MRVQINISDYEQESRGHLPLLLENISIMRRDFDVDIFIDNTVKKDYQILVFQETFPIEVGYELPWKCRKRLLDTIDDYDLFIYVENDVLLTINHIKNFLKLNEQGRYFKLLRYEIHGEEKTLPDVHIPEKKFQIVGNNLLVTNLHQGCFILTRAQLKNWVLISDIKKVETFTHNDVYYHILEAAATQPYIENDLKHTIEIDHIQDHLIYHAGNNYPHFNMTLEKIDL